MSEKGDDAKMTHQPIYRPFSNGLFLLLWCYIGLQSFGGGSSTVLLMKQAFIERTHWLSEEEFTHLWGLSFFAPGTHLIAFAILIGQKLSGMRGVLVSLLGLLIPSAILTCGMTASWTLLQRLPLFRASLQGLLPASAGLLLLLAVQILQPIVRKAWIGGRRQLLICSLIFLSGIVLANNFHIPVLLILCFSALIGAGTLKEAQWRKERKPD